MIPLKELIIIILLFVVNDYSPELILKYYKSGGMRGMSFRIEFYDNNTYKLFSYDELKSEDYLNDKQYMSVKFFRDNIADMQNEYCTSEGIADCFQRNIITGCKSISFGQAYNEKCMTIDIANHLEVLDFLIYS